MKKIGLILVVVAMLLAVLACGGSSGYTPRAEPTSSVRNFQVVVILDKCYHGSGDVFWFEGTVKNNSKEVLKYVKVRVTAYDGKGSIVGEDAWYIDSDLLRPQATSDWDGFIRDGGKGTRCRAELDDFKIQ